MPTVEIYVAEVGGVPAGVGVGRTTSSCARCTSCPRTRAAGVGSALHDFALERLRRAGVHGRRRLWTLEENWDARRFYERRGWTLTEETRVVPFPPNPIDVQYTRVALAGALPEPPRIETAPAPT